MRAETRHQLKQDRFSQATIGAAEATVHWTVEHKTRLVFGGVALAVVLAIAVGGWYYLNQQDQKASIQLNQAIRTLDTRYAPRERPRSPMHPASPPPRNARLKPRNNFRQLWPAIRIPGRGNLPATSWALARLSLEIMAQPKGS